MCERSLGLDVGGTKIECVLIENDQIIKELKVATEKSSETAFIRQLNQLIEELGDTASIGIGIAGPVEDHFVPIAPNLHFKNLDLRTSLKKDNLYVLNDVEAASYAEKIWGSAKGLDSFLTVYLGTGIGGFMEANSFRRNIEIGHMTIDIHGSICTCGAIGCLETISSGWGLAKRAGLKDAREVFEKTQKKVIEEGITGLQFALKNMVNLFKPKAILLGGGLLKGYLQYNPSFISDLENRIKREALPSYPVKLVQAKLALAGALGAARFALDESKKRSHR